MSNRLDQLFKDKLADHSHEPSANAWDRIKAGQSKKNKAVVIFRIAAGLLIAGALGGAVTWLSTQKENEANLSVVPEKQNTRSDYPVKETPAITSVQKQSSSPVTARQKHKKETTVIKKQVEPVQDNQVPESNKQTEAISNVPEPIKVAVTSSKKEKPIVIEYRLDAPRQSEIEQLTAKEKTGLQRVIDLAWEAKNGQSPVSLRQNERRTLCEKF